MLKKGLFVFLFLSYQCCFAQYHPVAAESSVQFNLKNFGFKTGGTLSGPEGDIIFNPDDLTKSSFSVTIKAESINTDNESRDAHLKEETYLDVKNYPLIRFVSSSVKENGKKGSYQTVGTLTIKSKSREVILPFTAERNSNGWTFSGSFKMNRKDYDVGGSSTLSDEVVVDIKVVAR
ncbi:MAG TPA: YceI family protein [Puia sp.]|jgi:polyisoprenoid-binding protein YceI|nr:YceI family protein [Puia sp.]